MTYLCRLVTYEPGGSRTGYLPTPTKIEASFVRNGVGSLKVEYAEGNPGGDTFLDVMREGRGTNDGIEVAVEVTDGTGGVWEEPLSGRFVYIDGAHDPTDRMGTISATMPSYGWLLGKARDLNTNASEPVGSPNEGKRDWDAEFDPAAATPGGIMKTLLDENAARGGIPITPNFTSTAATSWPAAPSSSWSYYGISLEVLYETGIDHLSVLNNLVEMRTCDWATEGRMLNLYPPGPHYYEPASIVIEPARKGTVSAPRQDTIRDLATRWLVRSDDGVAEIDYDATAPAPWGVWEGYRSQSGLSAADAAMLAEAEVTTHGKIKSQHTVTFRVLAGDPAPLIDYGPGDFVSMRTHKNSRTDLMVAQVTLTQDADDTLVTLVLDERIVEPDLKRARTLSNVVNGVAGAGGGGGSSYDTGWQDITLNSGFTILETPQVRQIGPVVHFRGRFSRDAGFWPTGYESVGTLPSGFEPNAGEYRAEAAAYSSGTARGLIVRITDGSSDLTVGGVGASGGTLHLSGIPSFLRD